MLRARRSGPSEELCTRAGTLDQQQATIERVSREIGALLDLVEENEAKGRVGQARGTTRVSLSVGRSMRLCAAMCLFVFRCVRLSFTRLLQLLAYTAVSLPVWLSLRLSVISMVMACTGPASVGRRALHSPREA